MLVRKTMVDQIEHCKDGILQIRIARLIEENGVQITREWHRTSIPQWIDPRAQMEAVNQHLESDGLPPVSEEDINWVVQSFVFNKTVHPMISEE